VAGVRRTSGSAAACGTAEKICRARSERMPTRSAHRRPLRGFPRFSALVHIRSRRRSDSPRCRVRERAPRRSEQGRPKLATANIACRPTPKAPMRSEGRATEPPCATVSSDSERWRAPTLGTPKCPSRWSKLVRPYRTFRSCLHRAVGLILQSAACSRCSTPASRSSASARNSESTILTSDSRKPRWRRAEKTLACASMRRGMRGLP
jgi:hypothetical protein